jgi:predicted dienelactone hydrolase
MKHRDFADPIALAPRTGSVVGAVRGLFTAALLALAFGAAQAGVGLLELAPRGDDGPVTVFYPTAATATAVERGPFRLQVAWQGAPARGNGRLVVLLHGSGGAPWTYGELASRLVEAGFIVALPEHRGDNWHDHADVGPASWKRRPLEVSRAIDAISADARFAPLLQLDRVGMYGMSAGGHTALTLAGGRWSPSVLRDHCEAHLADDFQSCVGLALELKGDWLDGAKLAVARPVVRQRLDDANWYAHTDARIAAVIADVPFAADFDPASLAQPKAALGFVRSGRDIWLVPRFHIDRIAQACQRCEMVVDLPEASQGSLMAPPPPQAAGTLGKLLRDPPTFDRAQVPQAHARIVAFYARQLLP